MLHSLYLIFARHERISRTPFFYVVKKLSSKLCLYSDLSKSDLIIKSTLSLRDNIFIMD